MLLQCRRSGFNPWVRKIPWRREWLPIPVFLPGEFHGEKSLVGYSPLGPRELDTTEQLTHTHKNCIFSSNFLQFWLGQNFLHFCVLDKTLFFFFLDKTFYTFSLNDLSYSHAFQYYLHTGVPEI